MFTSVQPTSGIVYRNTTNWNGTPANNARPLPPGGRHRDQPGHHLGVRRRWRRRPAQLSAYANDSALRGPYVGVTIDYRIRPDQNPLNLVGAYQGRLRRRASLPSSSCRPTPPVRHRPDEDRRGRPPAGGISTLDVAYSTVSGARPSRRPPPASAFRVRHPPRATSRRSSSTGRPTTSWRYEGGKRVRALEGAGTA